AKNCVQSSRQLHELLEIDPTGARCDIEQFRIMNIDLCVFPDSTLRKPVGIRPWKGIGFPRRERSFGSLFRHCSPPQDYGDLPLESSSIRPESASHEAGFDLHLSKPFDPDLLVAALV